MKRLLFIITFLFWLTICFSQVVIKKVTVVDVETFQLIPNQTVVLKDSLIDDIFKSGTKKLPRPDHVIHGKGKYLLPGLVDAHVHFFQDGGIFARPDAIDLRKFKSFNIQVEETKSKMEDFLRRYLANGITTVIDPGSTYNFLELRHQFAQKDYAPTIYMAGPLITTYEPEEFKNLQRDEPFILVKNPKEARAAVQTQLPYNPDFIKIWYITDWTGTHIEDSARKFLPLVKTIIDESHLHHLKVAVHATERITAQLAVEAGCDYLVHDIENEVVDESFLALLKSKGVILCPTLIVSDGYNKAFGQDLHPSQHEIEESNPASLQSIFDFPKLDPSLAKQYKIGIARNAASIAKEDSIKCINLKKMVDAGIPIATGTDAGNIGTQHAASYLAEVQAMQRCGMNNWQILQASTINPMKIFGKEKKLGSVAKGKVADLVLLNKNPVENLEHLTSINNVVKNGKVIDPDTLIIKQ